MAKTIDGDDDYSMVFKVRDREYKCDSLVFTSIIMDKVVGDEEPPKAVVVQAMREALDTSEGLTDHEVFAMSVRMTKAMSRAGNA